MSRLRLLLELRVFECKLLLLLMLLRLKKLRTSSHWLFHQLKLKLRSTKILKLSMWMLSKQSICKPSLKDGLTHSIDSWMSKSFLSACISNLSLRMVKSTYWVCLSLNTYQLNKRRKLRVRRKLVSDAQNSHLTFLLLLMSQSFLKTERMKFARESSELTERIIQKLSAFSLKVISLFQVSPCTSYKMWNSMMILTTTG